VFAKTIVAINSSSIIQVLRPGELTLLDGHLLLPQDPGGEDTAESTAEIDYQFTADTK